MAVDNYFEKIIQETEKDRIEFKEKANKYFNKVGFFELVLDKKIDVLKKEENLKILSAMTKKGFTLVEIAGILKVTSIDLKDIMTANGEIQDAIDYGYNFKNREVEDALYKLATGYTVEEKTTYKTKTGNREMIKEQIAEKFIQPNPTIAKYWSENRRRHEFKSNTAELVGANNNAFTIKVHFDDNE